MSVKLPSPSPSPEKKDLWFDVPKLQDQELVEGEEKDDDSAGLVAEGSNEFGLTAADYDFIQNDIELAIADFDREHGFDGTGYHDGCSNYIYPLSKVRKQKQSRKRRKSSIQEVAIAKGIIKVHYPVIESVKETDR